MSVPFESYATLLRMMVPLATRVAFFDRQGRARWTDDGEVDAEVQHCVKRFLREGFELESDVRVFPLGADPHDENALESFYVFVVRDDLGILASLVGFVCHNTFTSDSAKRLATTRRLLAPVLSVYRHALNTPLVTSANSADPPVEAMSSTPEAQGQSAWCRQQLDDLTDVVDCAFASLVIPEHKIAQQRRISPHESDVSVAAAVQLVLPSMAKWMRQRRAAVAINRLVAERGPIGRYKIAVAPIRSSNGRSLGLLMLFREKGDRDFTHADLASMNSVSQSISVQLHAQHALDSTGARCNSFAAFKHRVNRLLDQDASAHPHSLCFIDIDKLQRVNDTLGHAVADEVIQAVGTVIGDTVPGDALVAPIFGDRFCVWLANCDSAAACQVGDLIRHAVEQRVVVADIPLRITIGISESIRGVAIEHALADAEHACKSAKSRGGNRTEMFRLQRPGTAMHRAHGEMSGRVRHALTDGSFRLYAQRISPLRTGHRPARFEVLLRMQSASSIYTPEMFMSAARGSGLMPDIDRWVIRNSLRELDTRAELIANSNAEFCINIDAQSLVVPGFADFVAEEVAACTVPSDLLLFELTEPQSAESRISAGAFARRMNSAGCRIALDNFGANANSFATLGQIPVSCVKLDESMIREVVTNRRSELMVRGVARLATSMDIDTVVGRVEHDSLREKLVAMGVDYAQGYALSRPSTMNDALAELQYM